MGTSELSRLGVRLEEPTGEPPVVFVRGEIDLASVEGLRAALAQATTRADAVVLDLAGATFIDGSALAVLAMANARLPGGLRVRRASPSVARVFALVELDHLLAG